MIFNHNTDSLTESQKHLEIVLDSRLDFNEHLEIIFKKVSKTIGLFRKLQNLLPRKSLITVYKSFIRPRIDYGDIIYNQAYNASFHRKLESIQYNAALAITGVIRGTSKEKLYQELGFKSLQERRWYRKFCYFYKIFKEQSPNSLFRLVPTQNTRYAMRNSKGIPQCRTNQEYFKNSFFFPRT